MSRSPSASGLLPMPGSPSSSWALYKARFANVFRNADSSVLVAFWLFGTRPFTDTTSPLPLRKSALLTQGLLSFSSQV